MLELFQALAIRLAWLRPVAILVTVGFAALFVYAALAANAPDSFFAAGVAGTVWGLLLFVFLAMFPNVPALPPPSQTRWRRFVVRMRRAGYGLLVFAVLAVMAMSMSLTLKLLQSLPN